MDGHEKEISDLTDSYTKSFLPSLPFGVVVGIVTAAFHIAMDYVLAPLMILVIADLFFHGMADIFTRKRQGKMFKKILQYVSIFLLLTWLIIFELVLLRYNLTPVLEPVIKRHLLVYSFLGAAAFMSAKNMKDSLTALELPVSPFTKIFSIALEKFGPDLANLINKYSNKEKEDAKDKKSKPKK